jgi:hypothetical protein
VHEALSYWHGLRSSSRRLNLQQKQRSRGRPQHRRTTARHAIAVSNKKEKKRKKKHCRNTYDTRFFPELVTQK